MQGVSAQMWAPGRQAGGQVGTGSLLTIDHHVVAQDTGRVKGSLPWALKSIPALQGGPHAPIHVEELGGVHPHRESVGEGWERGSGQEGPLSLLWALRGRDPPGLRLALLDIYPLGTSNNSRAGPKSDTSLGSLHNLARAGHQAEVRGWIGEWVCVGKHVTKRLDDRVENG